MDWFTVEAIDPDTFAISEYGHWEEPHCYLLCGTQRAALIDTGLGVADLRAVVDRLTDLPVTVLTTHAHWDHIGGHAAFDSIAVHGAEYGWLASKFPLPREDVLRNLLRLPCTFPKDFRAEDYRIFHGIPQVILHDGDAIDLGGRSIAVLHTPGHSPGHCCFFEAERGDLYSGDLVYSGCLDAFYPTTDPQLFCRSVRRVQELCVKRIRPGHHRLDVPAGIIGRIAEAFAALDKGGLLHHGAGIFSFEDFSLHL